MSKIQKFTPAVCKKLRPMIDKGLAELGKEQGLTIHAKNASYTENTVTFKVEMVMAGFDQEKADFESYCSLYGLENSHYKTRFGYGRNEWELTGFNLRAPKYPVRATKLSDGKSYRLPERVLDNIKAKEVA